MDSGDCDRARTVSEPVATDGVEFHEPTGTYETHFDAAERPASQAVIAAVSNALGVDAMELPPLYDVVDPDALCALVGSPSTRSRRFRGSVTFAYAESLVTVDGGGRIEVDPLGGGRRPTG